MSSSCPVSYSQIEDLAGKNITADDELKWPCALRVFWIDILPFVELVRGLLSYGTSIIVALGLIDLSVGLPFFHPIQFTQCQIQELEAYIFPHSFSL